jgi:hypothetical protein
LSCHDSDSVVEARLHLRHWRSKAAGAKSIVAATVAHGQYCYTTDERHGTSQRIRLHYASINVSVLFAEFLASDSGVPIGKVLLRPEKRGNTTICSGTLTLSDAGTWAVSYEAP